jgi:catechol-2,3-dioxygenase
MNKAFDISRRRLLLSLPALMMAPRAFVQTANPPIRARGINHVTLDVSDVKRSVDFYQGLFGMPVINRQGTTSTHVFSKWHLTIEH